MKKRLLHIMPRSGSTMVRQILIELVEERYLATHQFVDGEDSVIITVRDFRDTFISLWRIWFGKFSNGMLLNSPNLKEIYDSLDRTHKQIEGLNKYKEAYKNKKIVIWRYEDFYNNPGYIIDQVEKEFGLKVSEEKRKKAIEMSGIERNREIQSKVKIVDEERIFNNFSKESHIHANHICEVEPVPGYWKQMVAPRFHKMIEFDLANDLKEWGYK